MFYHCFMQKRGAPGPVLGLGALRISFDSISFNSSAMLLKKIVEKIVDDSLLPVRITFQIDGIGIC